MNKKSQALLSFEAKLNICQQVTNAMTYLHDKNIVHGRLSSVNIYIEPNQRVKISLIDNDEHSLATKIEYQSTSTESNKTHLYPTNQTKCSFELNLTSMTYLSPEIVRTIRISKHDKDTSSSLENSKINCDSETVKIDTSQLTKQSDIYAFGSLLYELFEEKFPFSVNTNKTDFNSTPKSFGSPSFSSTPSRLDSPYDHLFIATSWKGNIKLSANELIFQIGSGKIGSKHQLSNNKMPLLQSYLAKCWSLEPQLRPQFKSLIFE